MAQFNLVTYNCRPVKSSVNEIRQLCDKYDIVMLQEHWLLPHDIGYLSMFHPEFLSVAKSAVNVTDNVLIGRPYGGTAIMYRKDIARNMVIVDSTDPRVCAVKILTNCGPVLLVCVYLPVDVGDAECLESYIATCAYVTALCAECDATQYVIAGDFNCRNGSRFYRVFMDLIADDGLCTTDSNNLVNAITYCNDA